MSHDPIMPTIVGLAILSYTLFELSMPKGKCITDYATAIYRKVREYCKS